VVTLREVSAHPEGPKALEELGKTYDIREVPGGLMMIQKIGDLRLFLYSAEEVLNAARRNQKNSRGGSDSPQSNEQPRQSQESATPNDLASGRDAIARLERHIERLQTAGKAVIEQREQWKRRAEAAEERLNDRNGTGPDQSDKRYGTLRRFLAKQFHPDQAPGSGIEKMIRSEMFKEIWAEIDRIDAEGR
jgi:hypothetical protein